MKTPSKPMHNPILDLLFAGQAVRLINREPEPWLVGADVCEILDIKNSRDAIQGVPEKWRSHVVVSDLGITEVRSNTGADLGTAEVSSANGSGVGTTEVRSSNGSDVGDTDTRSKRKRGENINRKMVIISPAGAMYLAFRSRKPEAQSFVNWLLEDVLPEIAKYGVYVAGADPAEKCTLLWHRWRHERAREIAAANTELEERGLKTISLFCDLKEIELRDVLSFARHASQCALELGEQRTRIYTRRGMRRAYSDAVLCAALARLQPQLPWTEGEAPSAPE